MKIKINKKQDNSSFHHLQNKVVFLADGKILQRKQIIGNFVINIQ